jgi:hypothetical protein
LIRVLCKSLSKAHKETLDARSRASYRFYSVGTGAAHRKNCDLLTLHTSLLSQHGL